MYIAESTSTPCQEWDAKLWFAKPDTMTNAKAKRLCYECPERIKCLESILRYEKKHGSQRGIYGGLDTKERKVFKTLTAAA